MVQCVSAPPQVIAHIFGGLGNQLFCYAAARRLALVNDVPLKMDTRSGFVRDRYKREYLLDRFAIDCEEASDWESYMHSGGRVRRKLAAMVNRHLPFDRRWYVEEEQSHRFDPRLLEFEVARSVYLSGYWQSEKYFADIEDVLRQNLRFRMSHRASSRQMAEEIANTDSVCVHMRNFKRAPHVTSGSIWTKPLAFAYYQKAIRKMKQELEQPAFYCFSDDIDWARVQLSMESVPIVYVDANAGRGYNGAVDDLWLISKCKHYILSNSTFSWWGAWLGREEDGLVVVAKELCQVDPNHYSAGRSNTVQL